MAYNTKITENLKWQSLKENFFIGSVKVDGKLVAVNNLDTAIEDGTIDALLLDCANELHDGDVYSALLAWSRNLSSQQTNMKKDYHPDAKQDWSRYNSLRTFVDKKMAEVKGSTANGNAKAYWEYTMEEINALTDAKTIKSVYDNMRSKKSKYPTVVAAIADYEDRLVVISKKRNDLIAAEKSGISKVDANLLAKLGKGNKATLSAQEAADLFAILAKLQK